MKKRNNREERLNYVKKLLGVDKDYLFEECFVIQLVKNDFVMKFVEKELNKIDDLEEVLSSTNVELNYDCYVIYSSLYSKMEQVSNLLMYIYYAEESKNLDMIERLIKKGYSKLYKSILYDNYIEVNVTVEDLNATAFILAFLNIDNVNTDDVEFMDILKQALLVFAQEFLSIVFYDNKNTDYDSIKLNKSLDALKKDFNLKNNFALVDLMSVAKSELDEVLKKYLENLGYTKIQISEEVNNDFFGKKGWEDKLLKTNLLEGTNYKVFRFITEISARFCFNFMRISIDAELNKGDMNNILSVLSVCIDKNVISEKEVKFYFFLLTYIYVVLKDSYDKSTAIVKLAVELEKAKYNSYLEKIELNEENSSLKEENNSLKHQVAEKDREIAELKKQLSIANAKINSLEDKISKEESNKEELIALRDLFFSLENMDIVEDTEEQEQDKELCLDNLKVTFVGGSDNLQVKVKEMFTGFKMVQVEDVTKDLTFLRNMDYVFLHSHMPHSLYYKVIDIIRLYNIPFSFLNEVNTNILKNNIVSKLKKIT